MRALEDTGSSLSPEENVGARGRSVTNPERRRVLGYVSADELVDASVLELVHEEDRELIAKRIEGIEETGALAPRRETKMLRRDGSHFFLDFFGVRALFAGVPAVLAMALDVTEQRSLA